MLNEAEFESELIRYLETVGNTKQWEYRPDIKTTEQLWQNFREILERNNQEALRGHPLTDGEFAQVQREICDLKTPYDAGRFLYGFNGRSTVSVMRDEAHDTEAQSMILTIFKQDEVGAGNTTYQIVNQIRREHVQAGMQNRRFDTTLLINGLPIIHIEEKADRHDAYEGLNQIHQYIDEGLFGDIYSTTQILIGMTPHDTRYMANTDARSFNTDFAFHWQTESENKTVWEWKAFCDKMLSIPMVHYMATKYMILDGARDHKQLMVMRPYQVYATRRVIERLRAHEFGIDPLEVGYVWHTTGSGKTVSSFKTAWLASRLPNVDKVVFLVDRRALTSQTYDNYAAYDPDTDDDNNGGVISDTRNTGDLRRRLRSFRTENNIIVTSIQKMGRLAKKMDSAIDDRNVVFIVDEAHRSTNGELLPLIKQRFPRSAWVGYTGTPVFDKDLTHKAFGDLIHAYTIREAIADKNVLGFQVDFEHTLSEDEIKEKLLPDLLRIKNPTLTDPEIEMRIASMTGEEVDSLVDSGIYDCNEQHVQAVVEDVISHWNSRSVNGKYSAIFTTHVGAGKPSAPMALMYFDAFQRANAKLIEQGKQPLNIAVTFSMDTSNSDIQFSKNAGLKEAIRIYNAAFGTQFGADTIEEYFNDVTDRLSGKAEGPKLDVVIVIDQLLTGFDSKIVNTLYVDRVLSGANLIQAYSRTNRVYDMQTKPFGHIVNYRWPLMSKRLMDAALKVYANPDSALVQGTLDGENQNEEDRGLDGVLTIPFSERVEQTCKIVDTLRDLTDDFTQIPPSEAQQEHAAELLHDYNNEIAALKQYTDYDPSHPERLLNQLRLSDDNHEWLLTSLRYGLQRIAVDYADSYIDTSDLNFEAEHVADVKVNYDYIEELLAKLLNQVHDHEPEADKTFDDLQHAIDRLPDRHHAEQIMRTAQDAMDGNLDAQHYPVEPSDVGGIVRTHMENSRRHAVLKFREDWGLVDIITATKLINTMLDRHVIGKDDLDMDESLSTLLNAAVKDRFYQTDAKKPDVRKLSPIRYKRELRQALREFADQVIADYS